MNIISIPNHSDDYKYTIIKNLYYCIETLAWVQNCLNVYYKDELIAVKFYMNLINLEQKILEEIRKRHLEKK